jgi:hypothetical protein
MMRRKTLEYGAVLGCVVLALAGPSATADDKDKTALSGAWVQKGGELKIEFGDKDTLKIFPHGDSDALVVVCGYTAEKGKPVQAKITELEGKGKEKAREHVPVGLEFSFTWQVKDGVATLDNVKGKNADILKSHLEGKYEKK